MSDGKEIIREEWDKRTAEWERMAATSGIKLPPGTKIDPKDIRVEVGPPMTEAQFKAWQERHKKFAKKFSQ